MSKKLYHLGLYETIANELRDSIRDFQNACVVVATTPHEARMLASTNAIDEKKEVWLDPKQTFCHVIQPDTCDIGILVADVVTWG